MQMLQSSAESIGQPKYMHWETDPKSGGFLHSASLWLFLYLVYIKYGENDMKRTLILFLLIMSSAFAFFVFEFEKVKIEDYEWKMRTIAHVEENQVVYDAVEEKDDIHQGAAVIDMTLIAKDGKITILDVTNGIFYEGTYLITSKNPKVRIIALQ